MPRSRDGDFSDTSSQYSQSSAGFSVSSMMSGSASQCARYQMRRGQRAPAQASGSGSMGDLFARLEAAEKQMQSQTFASGRSSDASEGEGRDKGLEGEQILDELERRSVKSGYSGQSGEEGAGRPLEQRLEQGSTVSSEKKSAPKSGTTHSSGHRSSTRMPRQDIEKLDTVEANKELSKMCDNKDDDIKELEEKLADEKEMKRAKEEQNQVLRAAVSKREVDEEDRRQETKTEHQSETSVLQVSKDNMQRKLNHAKKESDVIKDERDDLADMLAGLKARHLVELKQMKHDMKSEVEKALYEKMHEIEKKETAEANAKERANVLVEKLQVAEREKVKAQKEADILRVKEAMSKAEVTAKGAKIQAMRAEISGEKSDLAQTAPNASRLLENVFEAERRLQDEMIELKKQMKSLNAGDAQYENEMGKLQQKWDTATTRFKLLGTGEGSASFQKTQSSQSSSSHSPAPTLNMSSTRAFRNHWTNKPMLTPITEGEDPSNDGSVVAPSGHFSSNADEGVGDLHDFDDAVENPLGILKKPHSEDHQRMRREINDANARTDAMAEDLAQNKVDKELLKQKNASLEDRELFAEMETAQQLAADQSKIARLQHQLLKRREEQDDKDDIILELRQELGIKEVKNESARERLNLVWMKAEANQEGLQEAKVELESQRGEKVDLQDWIASLQEQLEQAWSARRSLEMRCEDYRLSMDAQEERHEKALDYLRQEIRILKRCQPSAEGGEADFQTELLALRKEVKRLEEEKNILQNVLEWKEVQWQSTIEALEQELAMQTAQVKQDVSRDQEDLLSKLDRQANNLRERLLSQQFATDSTSPTHEPVPKPGNDEAEERLLSQQFTTDSTSPTHEPVPKPGNDEAEAAERLQRFASLTSQALAAAGACPGEGAPSGSEGGSGREASDDSGGREAAAGARGA